MSECNHKIWKKVLLFSRRLGKLEDYYIPAGCLFLAALVYLRTFLGTEITDEAYYIAETLGNLRGNYPFTLNNYFAGIGYTFLPTPLFFFYKLLVPSGEGIVLFSRLCFVTFKLLVYFLVFLILRRHVKPVHAMLYLACSFSFSGLILNFNYNSIPPVVFSLASVLAFDSVEKPKPHKAIALVASGFLCGVTVFANPVYAAALLVLLPLIVIRSEKRERAWNLFFFLLGGLLDILCVFIPLVLRTGAEALWAGLSALLRNIFPVEPLSQMSKSDKLREVFRLVKLSLLFLPACLIVWLAPRIPMIKKQNNFKPQDDVLILVALYICLTLLVQLFIRSEWTSLYKTGASAVVLVLVIVLFGLARSFPLFLYLGLFPLLTTAMTIFGSSSSAVLARFQMLLYSLYAAILLLSEAERPSVRSLAVLSAAMCILLQGYTLYKVPYREGSLHTLTTKVESGVYKGIYTTPRRAHDLPELESFLNAQVSEEDFYAFRDNVPCGYLMMHTGQICDVSSWDCLQYSYGRNTPARLFDYYKRRDAIPDVIFYVDYGRDPVLSIENENFRYNDFVRAYYRLESESSLNDTFARILIYRYSGGFDGDYDRWVDQYNTEISPFPPG